MKAAGLLHNDYFIKDRCIRDRHTMLVFYTRPFYPCIYRMPYFYSQGNFYNPGVFLHLDPAFGLSVNALPFGYRSYFLGSIPYYYNAGIYYHPYNNDYKVVLPAFDAVVNNIPSNAKVTIIDGQKYYQLGGSFYEEQIAPNNTLQYIVVGTNGVINTKNNQLQQQPVNNGQNNIRPKVGDLVNQLPDNYSTDIQNRSKYFLSASGVYYQELIESN